MLKPGFYQHYKGPLYFVYECATHSENNEQYVVYRCLYGNFDLWLRPYSMFTESVLFEGAHVARFKLIQTAEICDFADLEVLKSMANDIHKNLAIK